MEYVRAGPFEIGVVDLADQMIAQEDDENGQQPGRQDGSGNDIRRDEAAAVRDRHALEIAMDDAGIQVEPGQADTAEGGIDDGRDGADPARDCSE